MKFLIPIFLWAALNANAQEFPTKPVRIIVPWPPSGNVDITARTVAPAFGEALGQGAVVENRPGAAGAIGSAAVAKSAADGYTLLLGSSGTITAGPAVWKTRHYDPVKDFVAIGAIQSVPIVLTAAPKTPVSTYAEYVAYAKQRQMSVASAGSGSSNHLAIELLMRMGNLNLLHVPYKGSGPALTDLLGSQVESMMDQLTASHCLGHIREGRIKPIAISSLKRSPLLPNVPTLDEAGVKGYEATTFTGIFAPAATPKQVVDKLHGALRKALTQDAVRTRYREMGVEIMDIGRTEFADYVRADYDKWLKVAREGNIVVE